MRAALALLYAENRFVALATYRLQTPTSRTPTNKNVSQTSYLDRRILGPLR
jgi:hypothetical protein